MQESFLLCLNHGTNNLLEQGHELLFLHSDLIFKCATLAILIDEIDILFFNDKLLKLNYVRVLEVSENFHLTLKKMF